MMGVNWCWWVWTVAVFLMVVGSIGDNSAKGKVVLAGIGVVSKADHFERRSLLRTTVGGYPSVAGGKALLRFFVAEPSSNAEMSRLRSEAEEHGDVHLVKVDEGYDNVPEQTLAMLQHYTAVEPAKFILKTDDDVLVRADMVVEWLDALAIAEGSKRVYAGWMVQGASVHRNGKWAVTKQEFPGDTWPR